MIEQSKWGVSKQTKQIMNLTAQIETLRKPEQGPQEVSGQQQTFYMRPGMAQTAV
jgi:hypothetical protein